MTRTEVLNLVHPSVLVYFEQPLRSAAGTDLFQAGEVGAIELRRIDSWGDEIALYNSPLLPKHAIGFCTANELAGKVRLATRDEEIAWIIRAARKEAS
jgi:hypothetical protein